MIQLQLNTVKKSMQENYDQKLITVSKQIQLAESKI